MSHLNLNHLEAFCVLSETLSFSRTAKLLATSQSAISRKIKILENNLGHELFLRSKKEVVLTKKGMILKDKILPNYKELIASIEPEKSQANILKIGSIYEAGERIFIPVLSKLLADKKISKFNLILRSSQELLDKLNNAELDFIMIHFPPVQKTIHSFEVFLDKTILIGPRNSSSAKFQKLDSVPLITYREDDTFTETFLKKTYSKKLYDKTHVIASVNSHKSMIDLVNSLNAFAVIPLSSLNEIDKNSVSIICRQEKTHSLYICTRENFLNNKQNKDFLMELIHSIKN